MRDGRYWLDRLMPGLAHVVRYMALARYHGVPDSEDRVGEALVALVEAADKFEPRRGKDHVGYFVRYVLGQVAGWMRNGAQVEADEAKQAISFTDLMRDEFGDDDMDDLWTRDGEPLEVVPLDPYCGRWQLAPRKLGIKYLYSYKDAELVLTNGNVVTTEEYIELVMSSQERREAAMRILHWGTPDDVDIPLQKAVGHAVEVLRQGIQSWHEAPTQDPVVTHPLPDTYITFTSANGKTRRHRIYGSEMAEILEHGARGYVFLPQEPVPYEDEIRREPWYSPERPSEGLNRDRDEWPQVVYDAYRKVVGAFTTANRFTTADPVLNYLGGCDVCLNRDQRDILEALDQLAVAIYVTELEGDIIAPDGPPEMGTWPIWMDKPSHGRIGALLNVDSDDEDRDSWARSVARALASRLAANKVGDRERLYDILCDYLEVQEDWEFTRPDHRAIESYVRGWINNICDHADVWPSQAVGIRALALDGRSPREAKRLESVEYHNQ